MVILALVITIVNPSQEDIATIVCVDGVTTAHVVLHVRVIMIAAHGAPIAVLTRFALLVSAAIDVVETTTAPSHAHVALLAAVLVVLIQLVVLSALAPVNVAEHVQYARTTDVQSFCLSVEINAPVTPIVRTQHKAARHA